MAKIISLKTKLVDVLNGNSGGDKNAKAKNSAEIKNGTGTLSVGQKARFDTTPTGPDGEYGGNDETVNGPEFKKEDGTSPIIEYSLKIDGKEVMNTAENPLQLGSYEDNGGCTPTFKLNTAVGAGRHKCELRAFVAAQYNDGVAVEGTPAVFYCD
jgi:hypothetical protein